MEPAEFCWVLFMHLLQLAVCKEVILASLGFQTPINCPTSLTAGNWASLVGRNVGCALPEQNFAPVKMEQQKERYWFSP